MSNYRFDHIHLMSPDPIKTAEFYERMFGATRSSVGEREGRAYEVDLVLNGMPIFVARQREGATVPGEPQSGLEHFGLRTDDIEAAVAELRAKGAEIILDVTDLRGILKIAFLRGPENVRIELAQWLRKDRIPGARSPL